MKILIVTRVLNTRTGGAARIVHGLSEALRRRGHQVDLIFTEEVPDPLRVFHLSGITFPILALLPIRRLTRTRGPYDIVQLHTLAGAPYVWLKKRFPRLPKSVILSYGADEQRWDLEKEEARLGLKPLKLWARLFYPSLVIGPVRYATRHADHVITAAQSEKRFYRETYRMAPEKISVMPNGVSPEFFTERDYTKPASSLLYVGGWEWRKGIRYVAHAFCSIAEKHPSVTLTLAGTGKGKDKVLSSFPKQWHARIQVIPGFSAEEAPCLYAQHDLFVFPSLFESMALALLEAMASGMPVITTRACGMQDVVEDGVSGFLIPPRDSSLLASRIESLLRDHALCERLGRNGQQKARGLTWDQVAAQYLTAFNAIVQNRSSQP